MAAILGRKFCITGSFAIATNSGLAKGLKQKGKSKLKITKCSAAQCPIQHNTVSIENCSLENKCPHYTPIEVEVKPAPKSINVLGNTYKLLLTNSETDFKLSKLEGYCDSSAKEIVVDDFSLSEEEILNKRNLSCVVKKNIRHEITHAFLYESGLDVNSEWATNEELIDWIAIQGLKLFKAWEEAGAAE